MCPKSTLWLSHKCHHHDGMHHMLKVRKRTQRKHVHCSIYFLSYTSHNSTLFYTIYYAFIHTINDWELGDRPTIWSVLANRCLNKGCDNPCCNCNITITPKSRYSWGTFTKSLEPPHLHLDIESSKLNIVLFERNPESRRPAPSLCLTADTQFL